MNSAAYSINFYTADGELDGQDSWSANQAIPFVDGLKDMPKGSYAVVLDEGLNEIYVKIY